MIFDKNLEPYIIVRDASIREAAAKIAAHKGRVLFCVDDNGCAIGALTNGDIIRWLSTKESVDLDRKVHEITNKEYKSARVGDAPEKTARLLQDVLYLPVVDHRNRVIAVARRREYGEGIEIEDRRISGDEPAFLIAEIGNNHNGSLDAAKRLIDEAVAAGADCAKFQMRDLEALYSNKGSANDASENLGSQYTLDLLNRYQLKTDELFTAFEYCREVGILPLCTPWDLPTISRLEEYGLGAYKTASADLTNHELIIALAATGKPLICSTGMSNEQELIETVDLLRQRGVAYVLLHCNSTYPPPLEDINLNYMQRLKELGACLVGYSGHERDIFISVAAVAKGAKIIEKHFTLDRSLEGNDHRVSLLPKEFKHMVEGIRQVESALGSDSKRVVTQGEMMNRVTLSKSIYASREIELGQIISSDMVEIKSPGKGVQPNKKNELIGRRAKRTLASGDVFYPSDLVDEKIGARKYRFERKWGLPVRHHDYRKLFKKTNLGLLEFHLSYKDLELDIEKYFDEKLDVELVIHAPELFENDLTLDLCSLDKDCREKSIDRMNEVVLLTKNLKKYFNNKGPVGIITNVGGFTEEAPAPASERASRGKILIESLKEIENESVEIWPQTMPPYPWHFGGRRYHNLFVEPEEIKTFCEDNNYRVCLDISHSKLACNQNKKSFKEFVAMVGPYTAHLHIADAAGTDGEGLQIGEGEIDFEWLGSELDRYAKNASMIPEVWQGHENEGEGFWVALERMEEAFAK